MWRCLVKAAFPKGWKRCEASHSSLLGAHGPWGEICCSAQRFFSSVSLTAYRKTCAARVAQEVGGLLKGLGVAFPLWPFGMGLVVFFLPEVLLPCPYFGSVVVADAQHHWHCVSMLVFSLSHFIKKEL